MTMLGTVHKPPGVSPELQNWAEGIAAEYVDVVTTGIAAHERSAQKLIGPSEIGIPCDRALIHKLAQTPEPDRGPAWKPAVGTACHTQMEEWFTKRAEDGWHVEEKVAVGNIGPDTIKGSTDLWFPGIVIDHKFVGATRLKTYKGKHGPGPQYRIQAHTYGKGWEDEGWQPRAVMIAFHLRDGELRDSHYWWEPYDRQIAINALKRANDRYALLRAFGLKEALGLFPLCDDVWCAWCAPERTLVNIQNSNPFSFK